MQNKIPVLWFTGRSGVDTGEFKTGSIFVEIVLNNNYDRKHRHDG